MINIRLRSNEAIACWSEELRGLHPLSQYRAEEIDFTRKPTNSEIPNFEGYRGRWSRADFIPVNHPEDIPGMNILMNIALTVNVVNTTEETPRNSAYPLGSIVARYRKQGREGTGATLDDDRKRIIVLKPTMNMRDMRMAKLAKSADFTRSSFPLPQRTCPFVD